MKDQNSKCVSLYEVLLDPTNQRILRLLNSDQINELAADVCKEAEGKIAKFMDFQKSS